MGPAEKRRGELRGVRGERFGPPIGKGGKEGGVLPEGRKSWRRGRGVNFNGGKRGGMGIPLFIPFLLLFQFPGGGVTQSSIPQIGYPLQVPKKGGHCPIRGIPLIPKGKICYGCPAHFQLYWSQKRGRYLCYRCPSNFQLGRKGGELRCWKKE